MTGKLSRSKRILHNQLSRGSSFSDSGHAAVNDQAFRIQRATIRDAFSISAILRRSFKEYRPQYTLRAFRATTPTPREVGNRAKEGPMWVATKRGKIVGTVSVVPKGNSLYVRSMAVVPQERGQGIARKLLMQCEGFASENGFKSMLLSTTPFLTAAIQLYEKYGFVRTAQGPHDLYGTRLFTMRKMLDS